MSKRFLRFFIRPLLSALGPLVWLLPVVTMLVLSDVVRYGADAVTEAVVFLTLLVLANLYGRRRIHLGCTPDRKERRSSHPWTAS